MRWKLAAGAIPFRLWLLIASEMFFSKMSQLKLNVWTPVIITDLTNLFSDENELKCCWFLSDFLKTDLFICNSVRLVLKGAASLNEQSTRFNSEFSHKSTTASHC